MPKKKASEMAVANTRHGDDYQVHFAMFYAFWFAYENNTQVEMRIEDTTYGKFDDLVITMPNQVWAMQLKHRKEEAGEYTLTNFTTRSDGGKKVSFYKYFDSLFSKLNNNELNEKHQFQFISNRPLSYEMQIYINPNTNGFSDDFFHSTNNTYITIFNSIKNNSRELNKVVSETDKKNIIDQFLRKVRLYFGNANRKSLAIDIKQRISNKFKIATDVIYHACFHDFYEWFITDKNMQPGTVIRNTVDIKRRFDKWFNNYISLERLCGFTQLRLAHIRKIFFPRTELQLLQTYIEDPNKYLILIDGKAGVGKSSLVKQCIDSQNYKDGQFIFVDAYELANLTQPLQVKSLEYLNIIYIDNAENLLQDSNLRNLMLQLVNNCAEAHKKIVLLLRETALDEIYRIFDAERNKSLRVNLAPLSSEQVRLFTENYSVLNQLVLDKNPILELLKIPFYLNLAIKYQANLRNIGIHSTALTDNVKNYLIELAIKQPATVKANLALTKIAKQRVSILRELLFLKSKDDTLYAKLNLLDKQLLVDGLCLDAILVGDGQTGYNFAHPLFEEWILHYIVAKRLEQAIEAKDDIENMLASLVHCLPNHTYAWCNLLLASTIFRGMFKQKLLELTGKAVSEFNFLFEPLPPARISYPILEEIENTIAIAVQYNCIGMLSWLVILFERAVEKFEHFFSINDYDENLEPRKFNFTKIISNAANNNNAIIVKFLFSYAKKRRYIEFDISDIFLLAINKRNWVLVNECLNNYKIAYFVIFNALKTIIANGYIELVDPLLTALINYENNSDYDDDYYDYDPPEQRKETRLTNLIEQLLSKAISNNQAQIVKMIFNYDTDFVIKQRNRYDDYNEYDDSPIQPVESFLGMAVRLHCGETAQTLLQRVTDIKVIYEGLIVSQRYQYTQVVPSLLIKADELYSNDNNCLKIYLKILVLTNSVKTLSLFLNQNKQAITIETLSKNLLLAIEKGHVESSQLLLRFGADVNCRIHYGWEDCFEVYSYLIHISVAKGNFSIVQLLVEHNANLEIKDNDGRTPLDIARKCNNITIINFLSERQKQAQGIEKASDASLLTLEEQPIHKSTINYGYKQYGFYRPISPSPQQVNPENSAIELPVIRIQGPNLEKDALQILAELSL